MQLLRSLRFAFRFLLCAPGYTAIAVLTLALGVGMTTSIFSVMNGTVLNPLPWDDPSTIVSIDVHRPKHDAELRDASYGQFVDWQRESRSYSGIVAIQFELANLTDRDEPHMVPAPRLTPNAFAVARVEPLLGRALEQRDGNPDAAPVAMMSEQLWTDRYAADPDILGRRIEIDGEPTTIVGIVAAARWLPYPNAAIVRPLVHTSLASSREGERLGVFGRLKAGVTVQQAQAEIDLLAERAAAQHPKTDRNLSLSVQLTRDTMVGARSKAGTLFLMGSVGFVLLIVCANLAGLLLVRAAGREKEIATRAALGASRGQIVAQLLSECAAIGLLALPLALLVTRVGRDYMLSLVPPRASFMREFFRIDARVAAFAIVAMAATVLLCGLYPALVSTRSNLDASLKSGGHRGSTGSRSQRLRSILVVVQIALAVALLATSSLLIGAFSKVQTVNPGFDSEGLLAADIALPDSRYQTPVRVRELQTRLSSAIAQLPGDGRAALVSNAPLGWDGSWRGFQIAGRETAGDEQAPRARWTSASAEYFSTLGLRTLAGRTFAATDTPGSQPVVVITTALAERYFPGENAVGRRITLERASTSPWPSGGAREIIGVVSDVKTFPGLETPVDQPRIYESLTQQPTPAFSLVVRSRRDDAGSVSDLLRRRVREVDPLLDLALLETMDTRFDRALWQSKFFIRLMGILGGLAFVLAAIGVYGVVSYTTARRTPEFGIRAALGAEPRQIGWLVLRGALVLAAWGSALGVALALLLGNASQKVLYASSGQDPITLAGVLIVLLVVILIATALPTARATQVNPATCLRAE